MWLAIVLISLAAFFMLLLSVPLDLAFRLDVRGRASFSLRLVWLFGLVSKEMRGKGGEKKEARARPKPKKRPGAILRLIRTRGLLRQLRVLVTDILGGLKIRQVTADLRVGLDNPADTGFLFAVVAPSLALLGPSARRSIKVTPSFEDEPTLEGYLGATVRLLPIRLVVPVLRFFFSLAFLRVLKRMALAKWKK